MASGRLQLTLADLALLLVGVACGLWTIRITGILHESSLPAPIYVLVFLDYFT